MSRPVVLIGFQDQGNLGIGYLAAMLDSHGHRVRVLDFERPRDEILAVVREERPVLVGFSLIFQFYLPQFAELAAALRDAGVESHFSIGGHFPSLSYGAALEMIPELDSVVRFEGEQTLLELVERLDEGADWRDVEGVAYRRDGGIVANPLRTMLADLDELPYPLREGEPERVLGHRALPILASRGCARTCSFCSIHMFYRASPGKIVRVRAAGKVVEEMRRLHDERGVTVFLFQDDDFPIFGPVWRRWAMEFVGELHRQGLVGRVIWKVSCRADAVDAELMTSLRDAGLYLVYMGLESGTEEGLRALHKQITVEQNLRAVALLKELDIMFEFGFMLFDPSSTFESLRDNVGFLRQIVGDGSAAAIFCKMLPYDGTPIKEDLAREGRLRGDVCNPDYDFLDPRLNDYWDRLSRAAYGWIRGTDAVSPQLNWAWHELAVIERTGCPVEGMEAYREALQALTRRSNEALFGLVEESSRLAEADRDPGLSREVLEPTRQEILAELHARRDAFVAANEAPLMSMIAPEPTAA